MADNEIKILFGQNLKKWLRKRDKTQADLCRFMGVSSATASDWCNGHAAPRADKLNRLAVWLGIELDDLLTDHGSTETKEPPLSDAEKDLLAAFRRLNRTGKAEALKRVSELSQISGYTEDTVSLIG